MSLEHFKDCLREAGSDDKLPQFNYASDRIHDSISYARYPIQNRQWTEEEFASDRYYSPKSCADKIDPTHKSTTAAMWVEAIVTQSTNASLDNTIHSGNAVTLSGHFKGTQLERIATECEEVLSTLKPVTDNKITKIDIEKMRLERKDTIKQHGDEKLVFLGLNGAGKDWMIGHLRNFTELLGIPISEIKMPNPSGVLFDTINKFLHGEIKLNPNSAQLLFMADAINTEISSGSLTVLNRHPAYDALVFGNEDLQPTVLSTHPLFKSAMHAIVVDRHPSVALKSVAQRDQPQRIFERKLEAMIDLHTKYASLIHLPGVRWLNANFSAPKQVDIVNYSVSRLLGIVQSFGIVQRTMVKLGLADNYLEANNQFERTYWGYKATIDSKYK